MARQTKAEKDAAVAAAEKDAAVAAAEKDAAVAAAEKDAAVAAAAESAGAGDPPPAPTPAATPRTRRRATGGALEGYPLDVMIGVGIESTSIDGVDYVVDPETGRITGTA